MRKWLVALVGSALIAGATYGCGGGGGGGGGGAAPPGGGTVPGPGVKYQPKGATAPLRPDIRTGTPIAVSLQDQLLHSFTVPTAPGRSFRLAVDTQFVGQPLLLLASEIGPDGAERPLIAAQTVVTPFTAIVAGATDGTINVAVFDEFQSGLTVSIGLLAQQQSANTSSFPVFVHLAGDSFAGFSSIPENVSYNDLVTTSDQQRFVGDLLRGVNAIWAPTGAQIDVGNSGFRALPTALIQDRSLIANGRTILDAGDQKTNVPARNWGREGIPASDANYGGAVDVFLVQDATPGLLGFACLIGRRGQGGFLEGAGTAHATIVALFRQSGPQPMTALIEVLAHELGHFMSLLHTTEYDFKPVEIGGSDDLSDTPLSTAVNDTDGDGELDDDDQLQDCPDVGNLMFPLRVPSTTQRTLTPQQGAAIRAYLALRNR